jgi:dienelactone hydrolase
VGYKDIHWINDSLCPDPVYSDKTQHDFSKNNIKHCHEIMARIYYPVTKQEFKSDYYAPFIKSAADNLKKQGNFSSTELSELKNIKSVTIPNATIIPKQQFPVLLFSPGFGMQTQIYENIITNLVSHGYIVIGINTIFVNGDISLPNGHVVKAAIPKSRHEAAKKFLPIQIEDLNFVYKKIHEQQNDEIFSSMDLKHIGAFGHSVGGRTVANVLDKHPDWFQAAATLDIAQYENKIVQTYRLPVMHMLSAYWESFFSWPIQFNLGKNNYVIVLSPSLTDLHYSYHLNYSDFSTIQYLPIFQTYLTEDKLKRFRKVDIKVQQKKLTSSEEQQVKSLLMF